MDAKMENLLQTLSRTGLCCSNVEAMKMAQSIMGTEKKVSTDFSRISQAYSKPKYNSYQEEIDDLIRKTNPNNKNYHIPISGYNRRREDGPAPAPVAQAAPRVSVPTPALVQEAPVVITELEAPAPKAVYTDVLQDTRALKDLVGEPVESIVIDSPQAPVLSAPLPKEEDEFILNVEPVAEVKAAPVVHAPAPAPVAQAPAERPRPKNPVASCDLSTYFMKH